MFPTAFSTTFGRRRTMLTLAVVGTIPAFAFTHSLVQHSRDRREQLAVDWARQGEQDLRAGRAAQAADEFRTAQQYARDRGEYRLQLAQALIAANRFVEAQAQLLTIWNQTPGDGVVNRELGRIAARDEDVANALRYYHAAIDGAWSGDAAEERRRTRTELAEFLLQRHATTQAHAELIALVGDLPPDPAAMTDAAALLLKADAGAQAMPLLQKALALDPRNPRALRLAGEAAFDLGDYPTARSDLEAAVAEAPLDARGEQLLDVSTRVLALDPFARRISSRERLRRIVRIYGVARAELERCPAGAQPDLQSQMDTLEPKMTEHDLARDPDLVDQAIALVTNVEASTQAACGPAQGDALALQLVLRQRRSSS
jgi:tetratricopeptide (TPR) repeat protein